MRSHSLKLVTALISALCLLMLFTAKVDAAVERKPVTVTNARWYPLYHIAAPAGWVNDPNDFCYYDGNYHFFYQHYPYDVKWGPMHWGHVVSEDLVHWEHLPIAIEPNSIYDASGNGGGAFSGSGIVKDGKLYLMYTGHVDLPVLTPEGIDRIESQNITISDDGIEFEKYEGNPVIYAPADKGDISGGDFRDPKMWVHDGMYYVVVGSTNKANTRGQVVVFESADLLNWNFKNIMARAEGNEGFMWECPNFAEIDGRDVLIISPQGIKPEGRKFLNQFQSGYMIGNMNYNTGVFTHGDFDILDYGFDFYAPQVTQAPDGRCILIGWLDMWGSEFAEQSDGWSCQMTIPRELHIRDGKVISVPAKEMEMLRMNPKSYSNVAVAKKTKLDGIRGVTGELVAAIDTTLAKGFSLELRSSSKEKTVLSYDNTTNILKLNRDKSGAILRGEREVRLSPGKVVNLRIYLDRSSIEVFVNDGEAVMSTRVYARETSQDIVFIPNGGTINLNSVAFCELAQGIPQPGN